MAISPKNLYPSRVIDGDGAYPYGKALNVQNGVEGTGTPLEAEWLNDIWGSQQALLAEAGIAPNGQPDSVGSSQYLSAIKKIIVEGAELDNGENLQQAIDNVQGFIDTRTFDTVDDMKLADLSVGDSVSTLFNATDVKTYWLITDTNPSPHYAITLNNGNYAKIVSSSVMDVKHFGASGTENENVILYLARAKSSGVTKALISNKTITGTSGDTSFDGMIIEGNDTLITSGSIKDANLVRMSHLYQNDFSEQATCPDIYGENSNKLVFRYPDSGVSVTSHRFGVCTVSSEGKGYILHQYKDNSGDASSISFGAPHAKLRSVYVEPVFSCVLMKQTTSADSGGITTNTAFIENIFTENTNNPLNPDGSTTGGTINTLEVGTSEWVEYEVEQGRVGKTCTDANVAFYSTGVNSTNLYINVDGKEVWRGTGANQGDENGIWTVSIRLSHSATSSVNTIRVGSDSGVQKVLGVNFYEMKEAPANLDFDVFKLWRDNPNPYINIDGASDYAVFDSDLSVWVGSYHGGEENVSLSLYADGEQYDLTTFTVGEFKLCRTFSIVQDTTIASKLNVHATITHDVDGVEKHRTYMSGDINVSTFYTMLTPCYREFDQVVHPKFSQNGAAGTLENLGNSQEVIQKRDSTGQFVRTSYTKFDLSKNSRACVYLDNKEGSPGIIQTRKTYYGPVYSNQANVKEIAFTTNREFGKGKY